MHSLIRQSLLRRSSLRRSLSATAKSQGKKQPWSDAHFRVAECGTAVRVKWSNSASAATSEFSSEWLRYNAPANRDAASGDRVGMCSFDLRLGERIRAAVSNDDTLRVLFENGDERDFDRQWLWEWSDVGDRVRRKDAGKVEPWLCDDMEGCDDMREQLPHSDTHKLLSGDADALWEVSTAINRHGFVLLRSDKGAAPADAAERVGRLLGGGQLQSTNFGSTFDVRTQMQYPMNAAYTSGALEAHSDLQTYEAPPGLQLLHCLEFDEHRVSGGESTLCDGIAAADWMRCAEPAHFATLCETPVTFRRVDGSESEYVRRAPHIALSGVDGSVRALRWYPHGEGPLIATGVAQRAYYAAYLAFARTLNSAQRTLRFRLRRGDVLVFNNRRMLHGRRAFAVSDDGDADGGDLAPLRHFKGAYVNIDDFNARLRAAARRRENPGFTLCNSADSSH